MRFKPYITNQTNQRSFFIVKRQQNEFLQTDELATVRRVRNVSNLKTFPQSSRIDAQTIRKLSLTRAKIFLS